MANDLQVALYATMAREAYPEAPGIRMVWHYLRHNETIIIEPSPEKLEPVIARAVAQISEIESLPANIEAYVPKPSYLCPWCDYSGICTQRYGTRRAPALDDVARQMAYQHEWLTQGR